MDTDDVIENFRANSLAHDMHPECEAGRWDRAVLSKLEAFARVEGVFGVLFDRQAEGEKLTAEDAIEEFRQAAIEDGWVRKPSDSQELPQASEPVPGNAGIVSRMPLGDPGYPWASYPWASYPWMPLDDALGRADSYAEAGDFTGEQEATIVLAAEVRRLREQDEKTRGMYAAAAWDRECLQKRRNELEAKLERVEALPAKWRNGTDSNGKTHAAELEAALRDET